MNHNQSNGFATYPAGSILQEISKNGYICTISPQPQQNYAKTLRDSDCKLSYQDSEDIAGLLPAIGLLRVNWRNSREEIISINYGTAFAVSSKMVFTCTHNIYSEHHRFLTSEIFFIPGLDGANTDGKVYRCTRQDQIRCRIPDQSLSYYPLKEELAVFVLDEGQEVHCENYVKIGSLQQQQDIELKIVGYPSQAYFKQINLDAVRPSRTSFKGKIHSIENHIINYGISTYVGQSGSPILAMDSQRQYFVIGIHTHRGFRPSFNSGLYFNDEILATIKNYQEQLNLLFPSSSRNIYHNSAKIKKGIFPSPEQYFQEMFDPGPDNTESLRFCQELAQQQYNQQFCFKQIDLSPSQPEHFLSLVSVSEDCSDIQELCKEIQSLLNDQFDRSDFISILSLPQQPFVFSKLDLSLQASTHIPLQISQISLDQSAEQIYGQILIQFLEIAASNRIQQEQKNVLAIARTQYPYDMK